MANNLIQIKRSLTTATPGSLANGEMAYTANGDVLFIGSNGVVIPLSGKRVPGVLTANQALVANATSGIDKIIVANAVLSTVSANGTIGSAGQYLASNGTTTYWVTPAGTSSPGGANTNIQFNDSGGLGGSTGLTFDKTTNNMVIGNTFTAAVVNAASMVAGTYGGAISGATQNTTVFAVGNSTVNATMNATTFSGTANNATNLGGTAASGYQTTAGLAANVATLTANNSTNLGGVAAASYATLAGSQTFAGNNTVAGTNTVFSSNVTITSANINATSSLLAIRDITVSGNLTVSGAVTTLNTSTLTVNDNVIEVGLNNTTTDAIDTGFFSPAGNSTAIWYSGIARIASLSSNTNPVFKVFVSNTNPNTATTIDTSANTKTGTLQAYLLPYGTGGAFVANLTNIAITANSTLAVALVANSLTLTTALPGTSGGTGLTTTANNTLYFGNSTNGFNGLALNTTAGTILQSNGTAIVYDTLDGGTF